MGTKRDSFRGFGLTESFAKAFKESKFYTIGYLHHQNDVVICVRDGYLNLYYKCGSIAKIQFVKNKIVGSVNANYLSDSSRNGYITLDDETFVSNIKAIMEGRDRKDYLDEKEAQERLFIDNNNNPMSEWYCVDLEYTKSIVSSSKAAEGRFDIIAVSKASPHRVALIELKYGGKAIGGTSGIREHVKDFYAFFKNKRYEEFKLELISTIKGLDTLGVQNMPECLKNIKEEDFCFAPLPEFYFITLNNNPGKEGEKTPQMSMNGYLINKDKWGLRRASTLLKKEGDYFKITEENKEFNVTFLFSTAVLPNLSITDIINDRNYFRDKITDKDKE